MAASSKDRETLRALARRWMENAALPVMADRKRQWRALKDLEPERPMVLFEIWTLEDYVAPGELACGDPALREVEKRMRAVIRQAEEIGDDLVVEPVWRVYWDIAKSDYGVPIIQERSTDSDGGHVGYHYNHPVKTPADVDRLRPRTWTVDREKTRRRKEMLEGIFGDILPVSLHGMGDHLAAMTSDLFRLIGNDNLLTWPYDAPDALKRLMVYLRDDRLAYYRWLESEGLLGTNNDSHIVGSGSPGYVSALPAPGFNGKARLRDIWIWMESQETTMISPAMFTEFFLPAMAEVSRLFGMIYYGCCEPVHDRWEPIIEAIPHVRAVSISPWCDQRVMAEKLGRKYVFSRKPKPWPLSGASPDWDALEKDIEETVAAARDGCLEILYRDVYRIAGDRPRLRRWADMVRSKIG